MHALLSSLMAALLGIYAFFGCCWQPHDCAHCMPATQQAAQPERCCDDDPGNDEQQHGKAPCKGVLECHGVCTYVLSPKVHFDPPELVVAVDPAAVVTSFSNVLQAGTTPWEILRLPDIASAPLRLHLMHQILLI